MKYDVRKWTIGGMLIGIVAAATSLDQTSVLGDFFMLATGGIFWGAVGYCIATWKNLKVDRH
jgi:hypothetical protein